MYEHRNAFTLAAVAAMTAAVALSAVHGRRGRVFVAPPVRQEVSSPAEAALLWRSRGVRGRTLVLFDRFPHDLAFPAGEARPPPENLVAHAIAHNVIRRLVFVVPDAGWREFVARERLYRPLREVPFTSGNALYLFTMSGVPLVAARESWLPPIDEDALVYVNREVFDESRADAALARRGISSDLWLSLRGGAR